MNREELFSIADKVGLGYVRHISDKDIGKVEDFAALVASAEREAILAVIGDNQCECRCSEVVRDRGQA